MNSDGSNSPNAESKDRFSDYSRRKEFKVKSFASQDERVQKLLWFLFWHNMEFSQGKDLGPLQEKWKTYAGQE